VVGTSRSVRMDSVFLLDGHGWFVASVEGGGDRWQTGGYPLLGGFCVKSQKKKGLLPRPLV